VKDRKRRLADVADARFEIEEAIAGGGSAPPAPPLRETDVRSDGARRARWRSVLPWTVAAATTIGLAAALALAIPWRTPSTRLPVRLTAELGVDASLATDGGTAAVLSPDGKVMAVPIAEAGDRLELGNPAQLFDSRLAVRVAAGPPLSSYAMTPDAQRFYMLAPSDQSESDRIHIVLNWPALLNGKE
jgi:hypothetical protein